MLKVPSTEMAVSTSSLRELKNQIAWIGNDRDGK
jgi:hypothetical protein